MRPHIPFALSAIIDRAAYAVLLALLTLAQGVGEASDIFFAVTTVPAVLMTVLNEAAFVIMLRVVTNPAPDEALRWRVTGQHGLALTLLFLGLGGGIALGADPLIRLLAPGLTGAAHDKAVQLQRLTAALLPLQGMAAIFGTVLIGHEKTWPGALRLPLTSGGAALGALLCLWQGDGSIDGFIFSLIAAAAVVTLGLGVRAFGLCHGLRVLHWPRRQVMVEMVRGLTVLGGSGMAANGIVLVERTLASGLGEGALSSISLARSFVPLLGVISTSVATGWFSLSLAKGRGQQQEPDIARTGCEMMTLSLLILVPLMALFLAHTADVVALLFERGRFTAADTGMLQPMAVAFALGAPLFAISIPLGRTLLMCKADGTLLVFAWGGFGLYIVLALLWSKGMGGGTFGLIAAYVVAMLIQSLAQMYYLTARLGRTLLAVPLGRLLCLAALVGAVLAISAHLMPGDVNRLIGLGADTGLTLAVFVLATSWLGLSPGRTAP
ncbi:conserved membrane hypothetical protein [Candidatus Terasakiella magnetica]|nr:conserved membrane hypothetical protein [Candidatus Terasakiella magnetica]